MRTVGQARAALLILLLAGSVWAAPKRNATQDGIDVSGLNAYGGLTVSQLTVAGLPAELSGTAVNGLALKPRRKLLSLRKPLLDLETATADARRLRLLLARNGYPQATIVGTGIPEGAENVAVTFTVRPGPAVVFGVVTVDGMPSTAGAAADSARIALPSGTRFREAAVFAVRDDLMLAMRRAGYPRADVNLQVLRPDSATVDLTFACAPGATFVYRVLEVQDAPEDLVPLVRKTVNLEEGTPYSPRVAADSRRYLRDLDLFRQIRLQNVPHDSTSLDLVADLRARKMLTLEASVGTFTDNPVVMTAYALHRNIFRRGRGLGAGASYATHYRWVEARTWWQGLYIRRTRTDLRLRHEVQDEDSYRLDKSSASLSTLFNLWRHSSFRTAITVSNGVLDNRSADVGAFIEEVGLQTVLSAMWFRDTSDNPLDPLTGSRLTLQGDWSPPGFWTDTPFAAVRAFGSRYLHLGGERVLAMRLDGAVAWPLGGAVDLTPDRRWYAGGVSSMRGYQRRRLGPVDSAGQPIGGEVRLLAGLEYRMPLVSALGLALFLDTGQVWRVAEDIEFDDYQAAVGAGALVRTPVGPLRLDVSHLVTDPGRDERRWLFHFAIGHPF